MLTQFGAPGRVKAGPISHNSTQYIDFVGFYISLDLSTIYFTHFGGC